MKSYQLARSTDALSLHKGSISMHGRPVNLQVSGTRLDTLTKEGGSAFLDYVSKLGLAEERAWWYCHSGSISFLMPKS